MGCEYSIKSDGNNSLLRIYCSDCFNGTSIENSADCMGGVNEILLEERGVDYIVIGGLVQKEYGKAQTSILKEIINVYDETRKWTQRIAIIGDCKECEPLRKNSLDECLGPLLINHPVWAYDKFIAHLHAEESRFETSDSEKCVECEYDYIEYLNRIRKIFESNSFFREIYRIGLRKGADRSIYKGFLSPTIRPCFSTSRVMLQPPHDATLEESYNIGGNIVRIYLSPGKTEYMYFVTPVEYALTPIKFDIINRARKVMLERRPKSLDFANKLGYRDYFRRAALRAVAEIAGGDIDGAGMDEFAEILTRHTVGLGVLEILLEDENIRDVYINAPANEAPICVNHAKYEDCVTNIYLTEDDVEVLASKFRARSGRPFSEASPVLDLELPEFNTRVAAIGKPLSPDGLAFALRRQKPTPWTLPRFIANDTISCLAAGLLSFLIDGQASILITGSRGSGKTSLLVSLIGEIMPGLRILTIEDTLEIPAKSFSKVGFRIQRLKVGSFVGTSEVEMTPQEALSTALRLGESVLIIGEVRGPETKVLYESMRIGAAGNCVLGTIHGASTASVFDRVVYDIGIPPSAFKATDVVVTIAPIKKEGGLRSYRRILQISEVTKGWPPQNPDPREVFHDLMSYDPQSDKLAPTEIFKKGSELIGSIARKWNLTYQQALENIELRSNVKRYILRKSRQTMRPELLELENVVLANNALRMLNEEYISKGSVEYHRLFEDWKKWFDEHSTSAT